MSNPSDRKPVLVLVGQTPPPYNGQTVMIEVLRAGLEGKRPLEHVRWDEPTGQLLARVAHRQISKLIAVQRFVFSAG